MSLDGDNPTTACDHLPASRGLAVAACVFCNEWIERQRCKVCKGTGQSPVRDGTETCEECDGSGDGEWEVVE